MLRVKWFPAALEAPYEATLLAATRSGIEKVYLTLLGGGVFGNDPAWIAYVAALR